MTLKEYSELVMSMPDYKFHEPCNGEILLVNDRWYLCVVFEDDIGEDFYLINFAGSFRYEQKNRVRFTDKYSNLSKDYDGRLEQNYIVQLE